MVATKNSGSLQLKVVLRDIRPPIWRRLIVPASMTLAEVHDVIQVSMGWYDAHLHAFEIGDKRYGVPDPDDWVEVKDEAKAVIGRVVSEGTKFRYEYDLGDGWEHDITVEKRLTESIECARCVTGRRACPPEDVGGSWGYGAFLEAIADPSHEEHARYREWIGGSFDPEAFGHEEIDGVNDGLLATRDLLMAGDGHLLSESLARLGQN